MPAKQASATRIGFTLDIHLPGWLLCQFGVVGVRLRLTLLALGNE